MKPRSLNNIQHLLQKIKAQLAWGDSATWSSRDFEELSDRIFSKTGNRVSVTTLKRAWGRANNTSRLSHATLNILAQFAGFENWRSFNQQHQQEKKQVSTPNRKKVSYRILGIIGLLLLIPILFLILSQAKVSDRSTKPLTAEEMTDIQFDFDKVTVGYPNTVLFRYDIGDVPYDTLQLQQSWDANRRRILDSSAGLVTSTYYHPGYYLAKLVRNNQIICQKDLYIPTAGWQARIDGDVPSPIYVKEDEILHDNTLHFQETVLAEMNQYPFAVLYLSQLSDKPQIKGDQLVFESEFRLSQPTDKSICRAMSVIITGTKEVFLFQFSIPGCVGDLMFALGGKMVFGNNNDFTAFGIDPMQWIDFQVTTRDHFLEAFIGEEKVFEYHLPADIGLVGGVTFRFEGLGEVRSVSMRDGEREVKWE